MEKHSAEMKQSPGSNTARSYPRNLQPESEEPSHPIQRLGSIAAVTSMIPKNGSKTIRAEPQSTLAVPEKISLSDLALGRLLAEAADLYHAEVLPGEMRIWSLCFQGESPEMLEKAFLEHFKTAKFMPRPGDIRAIIKRIRGERVDYWRMVPSRAETDAHQATKGWAEASLETRRAWAKAAGRPEPTT